MNKNILSTVLAGACALGVLASACAGVDKWFAEDAATLSAAIEAGGESPDGVWSNLEGQASVDDGKVMFDSDDANRIAYRPNVQLKSNKSSVTLTDFSFEGAHAQLPEMKEGAQAAVAVTTNGNGVCVFAVADNGAWRLTETQADPDGACTVRVDFTYGDSNTVSYYLVDGESETLIFGSAVNPKTKDEKVSAVEFAGCGSFAALSGVYEKTEIGVTINGVDVATGSGEGWTLSGNTIVLDGTVPYEIGGSKKANELVYSAPNGAVIRSVANGFVLTFTSEPVNGKLTVNGGFVALGDTFVKELEVLNGTVTLAKFVGERVVIAGGSVKVDNLSDIGLAPVNAAGDAVWCVTVPNVPATDVSSAVSEIANYGRDDIYPIDGKVYFWLPSDDYYFRVDGKPYTVAVAGGNVTADEREGVLFRANQIGVCSWTWHASISNILECMERGGYNGMQLALAPWLGIEQGALLFGGEEGKEAWDLVVKSIGEKKLNVMSTMINFPGEDYSTLHSISNTQGYMYGVLESWPDSEEHWKSNLFYTAEAAKLTKELGVKYLTTEIGFIEINPDLMFSRIKEICETCAVHGVTFLMESGPQTAFGMTNLLARLNAEGITNVGVNYDPGDDELFGSEGAVESFNAMWPWIMQCHIKDCKVIGEPQRKSWNTDCPWGDGYVSSMPFDGDKDFLATLRARNYDGNILFEYMTVEDGEPETLSPEREARIQHAMLTILASNNTDDPMPLWADSVWVKPSVMMGSTDGARAEAAMKAQGFSAADAAVVRENPQSYLTLKTWAEPTAAARKYGPEDLSGKAGVLMSAAIGAPALLTSDDVAVSAMEPSEDGAMSLTVKIGAGGFAVTDECLFAAALKSVGILGAYDLGAGGFSAENVELTDPVVDRAAGTVSVSATPKPVDEKAPNAFFFKASVK